VPVRSRGTQQVTAFPVKLRNQLVPGLPDPGIDPWLLMISQQKPQPVRCAEGRRAAVESIEIPHHGAFDRQATLGLLEIDQPDIRLAIDLTKDTCVRRGNSSAASGAGAYAVQLLPGGVSGHARRPLPASRFAPSPPRILQRRYIRTARGR